MKDADMVFYKKKIIEMVGEIKNKEFLYMIYGFVKRFFEEEAPKE